MYSDLDDLNRRPEPFSRYTTDTLWTDPWIAQKMLEYHLDQDTVLASRRFSDIDAIVDWINVRIGLEGKAVCDLGCGPGLYAKRMAERGARMIGIDFSAVSLAYARAEAEANDLTIEYRQADYLADDLPGGQDVVTLIYCDFCTLSPQNRQRLLRRIKGMLKPGGKVVFDVNTMSQFAEKREAATYGRNPMGDFWSPDDHFGFQTTFLYDEQKLALDRYLIVSPKRRFEIFNWLQHFDPETISAEVEEAGLIVEDVRAIATGEAWASQDGELAVIARA